MYGVPLAVASRMMTCFDVSGKSADMAEMDSMPLALSSLARDCDKRGR
jgi:hypothetical protein